MYSRTEIQNRLKSIDDEQLIELHKMELLHKQSKAKLKNNLDLEILKAETSLKKLKDLPLADFNKQYRNDDGSIDLDKLIGDEDV